jgi:hypothetical protein
MYPFSFTNLPHNRIDSLRDGGIQLEKSDLMFKWLMLIESASGKMPPNLASVKHLVALDAKHVLYELRYGLPADPQIYHLAVLEQIQAVGPPPAGGEWERSWHDEFAVAVETHLNVCTFSTRIQEEW